MNLSRNTLSQISPKINKPNYQNLPEKVLQFGTGVLLRGLPDYYINKANNLGIFNGSVVMVKSTSLGSVKNYQQQDNLYTICIRGVKGNEDVCENIISAAISRVLTASEEWDEILRIAGSDSLEIVISNTTEVGIQLVEDDIFASPPVSFPGKLLAVLNHRFRTFKGDVNKGLVIVPTELIVGNGNKLKAIMLILAKKHQLSSDFIYWLENANDFCNSLVDRIVPGIPDKESKAELIKELGYDDDLLIMSEVYSLWAIQGGERVKQKLTFATADENVVIKPDIEKFREMKLRLLNGTHTLSCGVAYLAGFDTVKESLEDEYITHFLKGVMENEIVPAIPFDLEKSEALAFSKDVLDRFRNPQIKHQWLSISMNYTSKLKMRVLPILINFERKFNTVPDLIAFGFAAYLRFINVVKMDSDHYYGESNGKTYRINDNSISYIYNNYLKKGNSPIAVLKDLTLWDVDLTSLKGFEKKVNDYLIAINEKSVKEVLNNQTFAGGLLK